ncbi:PREDICTED: oxysterol-binding protein-related protein 2 isoform X1 [Drosophila arizonae]|uniref:Oxysterol-binding protein n=1 Tax=Drosophila arizonae TaxID=7263 RepID=A0ABM1PI83_DROAR|nr:PREDICTED: oxysterol-binding protein-related protein 2 isoform X1 [Drosophila arizonae]XP_017866920.1 PREDICTED: oxysterol-binding protein-related protein 2 isoform X1 [Drosophila arizonae]
MAESADNEYIARRELPAPMLSRKKISVWSVLKNCIGKDLSKITMPVELNEPLSFLQRICEYMEYANVLTYAAHQDNPVDRMKYVAAFAVSALASNLDRLGKPFNPILGETYELQRENYRIVCEQVSHHPPISAFHAESNDFNFYGSINPKIKFSGKNVEIRPTGVVTVEFPKWNETYTWSNVNCCVHNIIVGKLWIEQYGTIEITNHATGHVATLTFKSSGLSDKDLYRVEGFVKDENQQKLLFLYGKWTKFLKCCSMEDYEEHMQQEKKIEEEKHCNSTHNAAQGKMFSKLNSFKLDSFRSLSLQEDKEFTPNETNDGLPRSDSDISLNLPNSILLWRCKPRPANSSEYYHFTNFALQLNVMESNMKPPDTLCPTDARLRPDILCLEQGDLDGASREKARLEKQQRDYRKQEKNSDELGPRWFKKAYNPYTKSEAWIYNGNYWDRNYKNVNAIF